MEEKIYSMGIDIGTATTEIIFGEITITNSSNSKYICKNKITQKQVIYKSEIYFTPFVNDNTIDFKRLKYIIENEFIKSGISKEDISVGAIIVTGEAARMKNAKEVLNTLSHFSGKFITAVAGSDFEAVFSGYGSGACKISKQIKGRVLNYDLGGGTTNISVFNCGKVEDAFAIDIGGKLIRFNDDGTIKYISNKIKFLIKKMNLPIEVGEKPEFNNLVKLCYRFSTMLIELAGFSKIKMDTLKLFIDHRNKKLPIDYVTFSGGIAEYIYSDVEKVNESFMMFYRDIGPILGFCIKNTFKNYKDKIKCAEEKINAKAIGVANNSFVLSGGTITFDKELLPLKNVPIVRDFEYEAEDYNKLFENIQVKLKMYDSIPVAVAFKGPAYPTYDNIKLIANKIVQICKNREQLIIIIVENDFAMALGQEIRLELKDNKKIICIDSVDINNGDYIDIGKNIGGAVTVSIRTLEFNN